MPIRPGFASLCLALILSRAAIGAEFVDEITPAQLGTDTANGTLLNTKIGEAVARAGDTRIVLPAGATFTRAGGFHILRKADDGYVTIESSQLGLLPEGKRVKPITNWADWPAGTPLDSAKMPRILTADNQAAIKITTGRHIRLRGLEISSNHNLAMTHMVQLGTDNQTVIDQQAAWIEIDRCYIHANDPVGGNPQVLRRTVRLDSGNTIITNSHLSGSKSPDQPEAHAIAGVNGMGPYFIINNFLEGAGENFIIGGGGTTLPEGTIPRNIHFKRNYVFKPPAWRTTIYPGQTKKWLVKNLFEMKFGTGWDIDGNIFENTWGSTAGGQDFAIVFKCGAQGSSHNTESEIRTDDVLFRNNKIIHASGALHLEGRDYNKDWPIGMHRVQVKNNLWDDISHTLYGQQTTIAGSFAYITNGTIDTLIEHNTCFVPTRYVLFSETSSSASVQGVLKHENLTFRNNVMGYGTTSGANGVKGYTSGVGTWTGSAALNNTATNVNWDKNVFMGGSSSALSGHTGGWNPVSLGFPTSWAGVLVNQTSPGADHLGYEVVPTSDYNNAGSDGKDPGADIPAINAATIGCVAGVWNAGDVVLYPGDGSAQRFGSFNVDATDATAANGVKMRDPNAGAARVNTPAAAPAHYFELTFNAKANTPYRLWMRMKADADSNDNDSVWVQFNNSVDAAGAPIFRSGTTSGTIVALEAIFPDGVQGWGWSDNDLIGGNGNGTLIRFATDGLQTIRVQRREDGVAIDQIVLSPSTYLGGGWIFDRAGVKVAQGADPSPGLLKNDSTILRKTASVPSMLIAADGFNYVVPGSLNTQNGGSGYGNAWTAVTGQASPALAAGSMTYTDGTRNLATSGNKLQPAVTSRSSRNFATAITTNNTTKWVSFRINHTGTGTLPTNHAGFSLRAGLDGSGNEIFLGKPGFGATNWGMDHTGTWVQKPGAVTTGDRNAFLVYRLAFTATDVTISMWVNPSLAGEASLGTPHQTLTKPHANTVQSMMVSTGTNASSFQLDEFRIGNTFADVAPTQ